MKRGKKGGKLSKKNNASFWVIKSNKLIRREKKHKTRGGNDQYA